jgi:CRISPR/Cas system-associated protein Cas5 (RAMP superfamily)
MAKVEIYDSLDAPVIVWEKVHKTGDLSNLLISKTKINDNLQVKLEAAWEKMYNEYLEEFGFSDSFKSLKNKEIEIALLKCKLIQSEDRSFETEIEIAELELLDIKSEITESDFKEAKIAIEKNLKFQINMSTTSIREFYAYINDLK